MLLWVFGGLFTMLGAVAFAELAAMFPRTGGQFVFLREAYGDFPAFLFGWAQFLVIQTGTNAAVAIAFAKYLSALVPDLGEKNILATVPLGELLPAALQTHIPHALMQLQLNSAQLVASGVIALLTGVNIRGVREGAWVQNVFTVLKVAALLALIVAGLMRGGGTAHFFPLFSTAVGPSAVEAGFLAGLAVALSFALFAYDAWYTVAFVAEEVHDSHRTLPRAMVLGCLLVTILYFLANFVYILVLPIDQIAAAKENRVAKDVAFALFGNTGATLVIVAILVFDVRLPERADSRRRPRVLRHGPRRTLLSTVCPAERPKDARRGVGFSGRLVDGAGVNRFVRGIVDVHLFCLGPFRRRGGCGRLSSAHHSTGPAAPLSLLGLSSHAGPLSGHLRGLFDLRRPRQTAGNGNWPAVDAQRDSVLCRVEEEGGFVDKMIGPVTRVERGLS